MHMLYKYPQQAFPYAELVAENARRGYHDFEYELLDTGIFDDNRYFDVFVTYAKAAQDDILITISAANRGPDPAPLHCCPHYGFVTYGVGATQPGQWATYPISPCCTLSPVLKAHWRLKPWTQRSAHTIYTPNQPTNLSRLTTKPTPSAFLASLTQRPMSKTPFTAPLWLAKKAALTRSKRVPKRRPYTGV
jgi:hypothetical protein